MGRTASAVIAMDPLHPPSSAAAVVAAAVVAAAVVALAVVVGAAVVVASVVGAAVVDAGALPSVVGVSDVAGAVVWPAEGTYPSGASSQMRNQNVAEDSRKPKRA